MKQTILVFALLFLFSACSSTQSVDIPTPTKVSEIDQLKYTARIEAPIPETKKQKAKNIILLIGDGMGLSQISSGLFTNDNQLYLEYFKNIGLHKPYSGSKLITDSAAAATSFACGIKTYNGAIGVNSQKKPVDSILEESERVGKATGLVSTSTIVHATPASFIAHQEKRKMYEEIAADFLKTDIDVFIGGGQKFFDQREIDDRVLSDELKSKGYVIKSYFDTEIDEVTAIPNQKLVYYTANNDPLPVLQGRDYLESASMLAIKQLNMNSDDGFFLMIEGAQIDWGGHANNADYIMSEMLEFDKTIGTILKWAIEDKNTLVIVTADHETGGFAINSGKMGGVLETAFTTDYHTGVLIPVFAYGPGSQDFRGIYENTAIYHKMRKAFGYPSKEK